MVRKGMTAVVLVLAASLPAWAKQTFVGEVAIRRDATGRLAVALDEITPQGGADGRADRVFVLTPEKPLEEPIDLRFPMASIVLDSGQLQMTVPGSSFSVDLALSSPQDRRKEISAERILFHAGVALLNFRSDFGVGVAAVNTDSWLTVDDGDHSEGWEECQAGGEGASSCSYKCPWPLYEECGVSCKSGYHACCGCSRMASKPYCHCALDSAQLVPGGSSQIGGLSGGVVP